jgi:hypothetical protein
MMMERKSLELYPRTRRVIEQKPTRRRTKAIGCSDSSSINSFGCSDQENAMHHTDA